MVDGNLIVANYTSNLAADDTTAALYIGGEGEHELWVKVPQSEQAGNTLDISLKASATSGGTYTTFATMDQITYAMVATNLQRYFRKRFSMPPGKPYLKVLNDVGGTIAAAGFGVVVEGVGVAEGPDINSNDSVVYAARPTAP